MGTRYGGFWRRVMAFCGDTIILSLLSLIIGFFGIFLSIRYGFHSPRGDFAMERIFEILATFFFAYTVTAVFIHMVYFTYFHGTLGQTPGKMVLGLRVVRATGEEMTVGIGFLRWVGYVVSTFLFFLGFLWITVDKKKRGWHDIIAGTVVIQEDENLVNGRACDSTEKYLDKGADGGIEIHF